MSEIVSVDFLIGLPPTPPEIKLLRRDPPSAEEQESVAGACQIKIEVQLQPSTVYTYRILEREAPSLRCGHSYLPFVSGSIRRSRPMSNVEAKVIDLSLLQSSERRSWAYLKKLQLI